MIDDDVADAAAMERRIREYFDACHSGDADAEAAHFCDPATARAVIEWTHVKTVDGVVLRGDEWYVFEPGTWLIREIRAYYASPQAPDTARLELQGFPYAERGYPESPA